MENNKKIIEKRNEVPNELSHTLISIKDKAVAVGLHIYIQFYTKAAY